MTPKIADSFEAFHGSEIGLLTGGNKKYTNSASSLRKCHSGNEIGQVKLEFPSQGHTHMNCQDEYEILTG